MSFTVFLGNLPVWVTADDIKSWLSSENLVADAIKVIRNPETQESKGFAFIESPNQDEMNAIIRRFDRAPLEDRLLARQSRATTEVWKGSSKARYTTRSDEAPANHRTRGDRQAAQAQVRRAKLRMAAVQMRLHGKVLLQRSSQRLFSPRAPLLSSFPSFLSPREYILEVFCFLSALAIIAMGVILRNINCSCSCGESVVFV